MSRVVRVRIARIGTERRGSVLSWIGRRIPAVLRRRVGDHAAGTKVIFALVGAVAGATLSTGARSMFAAAVLASGGWRWPQIQAAHEREQQRRKILSSLPDVLDLVGACVRAGTSVERAFAIAAEHDAGPLGEAMCDAVDALEHGLPKDEAYRLLCERADVVEVRTVVSAIRRAERLGTSITATLDALAQDMRERRRSRAEERARSAPVRMLFPVILCFLPAFVVLSIAPVLIVAVRGFRGT